MSKKLVLLVFSNIAITCAFYYSNLITHGDDSYNLHLLIKLRCTQINETQQTAQK